MIIVRRAKIEDKPAIFNFIQKAYKGRWQYKIPDRWNWEYVDNPFIGSKELPIWIAVDGDGEVVGQSCAMIEPLKLGNTIHRMGWGVDLYVDPKYRGQGLGAQLKKANDASHEIFMSLTMADLTQRINTELGFASIEPVPTYMRVNQLGPDRATMALLDRVIPRGAIIKRGLAKLFRSIKVDRIIATRANQNRLRKDARLAESVEPGLSITQIDRFDEEIDQVWEEVSPYFHALIKRDHVYLNWKFVQQPHVEHIKLIARRHGKLCGYIILRKSKAPEPNVGIIVDTFVSPGEQSILVALISKAVGYFVHEQVKSIIVATSVNAYQECLTNFGFTKVAEDVPMVHFKNFDPDSKTSLQPGKWLLSKGDQDWDQYPLATETP